MKALILFVALTSLFTFVGSRGAEAGLNDDQKIKLMTIKTNANQQKLDALQIQNDPKTSEASKQHAENIRATAIVTWTEAQDLLTS